MEAVDFLTPSIEDFEMLVFAESEISVDDGVFDVFGDLLGAFGRLLVLGVLLEALQFLIKDLV